jgi:iron complex outermembrane receptor protein
MVPKSSNPPCGTEYRSSDRGTCEVVEDLKLVAGGRNTHDRLKNELRSIRALFVTLGVPLILSGCTLRTRLCYCLARYNLDQDMVVYQNLRPWLQGAGIRPGCASQVQEPAGVCV